MDRYRLNIEPKSLIKEIKSTHQKALSQLYNARIHFVGLGDAGINVLRHMYKKGIEGDYTCITNQKEPLPDVFKRIKYSPPGQLKIFDQFDGVQEFISDMNQPLILPKQVKEIFNNRKKFILFAGLGRYTGTFMIRELNKWLNEEEITVQYICSSPFSFEGFSPNYWAENVLNAFQFNKKLHCYDLNKIREKYGDTNMLEAFGYGNEEMFLLYQSTL